MEIKIKVKDTKKTKILEKLTFILLGVFLTTLIFAFLMRYLGEFGMWLALAVSFILVFSGFYHIEKETRLRLITWGILGTLIILGTFLILTLTLLSNSLEGF